MTRGERGGGDGGDDGGVGNVSERPLSRVLFGRVARTRLQGCSYKGLQSERTVM